MKTVVRNLTNNSTITLPPCFNSYPLPHNADKDFSYTKDIPTADLSALTKLALQGKISFPGSTGLNILAGLPISALLTYVLNGQEPANQLPGTKCWSINDNVFRTCTGAGVWSSSQAMSTLVPVESWSFAAKVGTQHAFAAGVVDLAGKFVVACGDNFFGNSESVVTESLDPATNVWKRLQDLPGQKRQNAAMITLPTGKILLAGGVFIQAGQFTRLTDCWLLDPVLGTWTQTGSLPIGIACEGRYNIIMLSTDKVLFVGGGNQDDANITGDRSKKAFIYTVSTGVWDYTRKVSDNSISEMNHKRGECPMVIMPNGKVLIVGGRTVAPDFASNFNKTCEVYDPATGLFTDTPSMPVITGEDDNAFANKGERALCSANLVTSGANAGKVLIAGGYFHNNVGALYIRKSSIWYTPSDNSFAQGPDMSIARAEHAFLNRIDGKVLIALGVDFNINPTVKCEVYDPELDAFEPIQDAPGRFSHGVTTSLVPYMDTGIDNRTWDILPNGNFIVTGGLSFNKNFGATGANRETLIYQQSGSPDVRPSIAATADAPTKTAQIAARSALGD